MGKKCKRKEGKVTIRKKIEEKNRKVLGIKSKRREEKSWEKCKRKEGKSSKEKSKGEKRRVGKIEEKRRKVLGRKSKRREWNN